VLDAPAGGTHSLVVSCLTLHAALAITSYTRAMHTHSLPPTARRLHDVRRLCGARTRVLRGAGGGLCRRRWAREGGVEGRGKARVRTPHTHTLSPCVRLRLRFCCS
jgi:hypothetical protein